MPSTVADQFAEILAASGAKRIYSVVGARNKAQLHDNLDAVGWSLMPEQIKCLDEASAVTPAGVRGRMDPEEWERHVPGSVVTAHDNANHDSPSASARSLASTGDQRPEKTLCGMNLMSNIFIRNILFLPTFFYE